MAVQAVAFRVDVQRSGQERLVTLTAERIHASPRASFRFDPQDSQWEQYRSQFGSHQTSDQFFREVGSSLFESLLPDQHRISYEINYQNVKEDAENRALCVQLRILDEELSDLPWECLYNPVSRLWLSANALTPLSRYVDAQAPPAARVEPPLRLLVVTAEPRTLDSINAEAEVQAVNRALAPLLKEKLVDVRLLTHGSRSSLQAVIEEFKPHLFHFVGHG